MSAPRRLVLAGGAVVDPDGDEPRRADVAIEGDRVAAVGDVRPGPDDEVLDCSGRLVLPGFVDAHSHAEGLLADDAVQLSLLRQGVTTVVGGQDGVSFVPGDGAFAAECFGVIDGPVPGYHASTVGGLLDAVDGVTRVNLAMLAPAGTIRALVCGRSTGSASAAERAGMRGLVAAALDDGAVGLSTGLDYVPGLFADAAEIAALAEPVAEAGAVYVSHVRGYERRLPDAMAEVRDIAGRATAATGVGLPVHVSHLHADTSVVLDELASLEASGVSATFDSYPYSRGCSLLAMPLLPPELAARPADEVVAVLTDAEGRRAGAAAVRARIATEPDLGPGWAERFTLSHLGAARWADAQGARVSDVARGAGLDPVDLVLDVLVATRLRATVIMAVAHPRSPAELAPLVAHPAHTGGSDGIFVGAHPHPRARGTFARYLRQHVRELGTWSWGEAARHLSLTAAARFGLGERGLVRPGATADLVVVDPHAVTDRATYDEPMRDADGIDDVLVAGMPVLRDGSLTRATPGRGIRRERP